MKRFGIVLSASVLFATCLALFSDERIAKADNAYFALAPATPFLQDWTNIGLITSDDNWMGVPSIIGYLGEAGGSTEDVNAQTVLTTFVTLDVQANETNPSTFTTGGVAEFQITDPVVALQASGAADFPSIDIRLNTSECALSANTINVSYNARDIDGSVDNSVQQVALQYRIGSIGDYTNIPAGYIADATTGPSLATMVTPILVSLPAAAKGQAQVHVRMITTNAAGNDEWVGIDDINISCLASSAASVSLGGRIVNADGRGIRNATVIVSGGGLGQPRRALTGPFGYYTLENLRAGETYVVTVRTKRSSLQTSSRVVTLNDELADIDFVADPYP